MRFLFPILCLLLLIFQLFAPINATAQLSFTPMIVEPAAYPGGIERFHLTMTNNGVDTLTCRIEIYSMDVIGEGLPVPTEYGPRSCREWIDVTPGEFVLEPKGATRLMCTVRPPKNAIGGYYAIISCSGTPENQKVSESDRTNAAVRFRYRVQSVILLTVKGSQLKAVIEPGEPKIDTQKDGAAFMLEVPVRNRGNVHGRMVGRVTVKSEAGQTIDQFELASGRGFILPGQERFFKNKQPLNLQDGLYLAEIMLKTENGHVQKRNFPFAIKNGEPVVAQITDELRKELTETSAGFMVATPDIQLSLIPGGKRPQVIELRNLTRNKILVDASVIEWIQDINGDNLVVEDKKEHVRSASDWIKLRIPKTELRPLSKANIPIIVDLPRDAKGEYYAAITFDRDDIQLNRSPKNRAKRSVLLRVAAKGTNNAKATIESFKALRSDNGAVTLTTLIDNTGDIGIIPEVTFGILNEYNEELGLLRAIDDRVFVQAGAKREISMNWDKILNAGKYFAEIVLRYDPNKPPIIQRVDFNID